MSDPVCLHLDLDAFFASVELLDHPSWRGQPVIVGARPGQRGVVATCSYEARAFGVRSAMPVSEAYRLCPGGIFTPVRMGRYLELSRTVMGLVRSAVPRFVQVSVDEAYVDLSGTERLLGPAPEVARGLKAAVAAATGLTLSLGLAPTWHLAKIASDFGKPDGLTVITPAQVDAFLEALPLKKLHGAGGKTRERLEALGVRSVAGLRAWSRPDLVRALGEGSGGFLFAACRGQADTDPFREARSHSVSSETTFAEDQGDPEVLEATLLRLCAEVAARALDEGWQSRTVQLKLRWSDFRTVSAQTTRERPLASSTELYRCARALLDSRWTAGQPVRLLGVGLTGLERAGGPGQGELFAGNEQKQGLVERALADLRRERPASARVTRASLLGRDRRTR